MNPFFPFNDLPDYAAITPELAEGAITRMLQDARSQIAQLEENATASWDGCMAPRYDLTDPISYAWSIVSHMLGAMNAPAWRTVHEKLQPHVISFFSELGQNQTFYKAMDQLAHSKAFNTLNEAQKRILKSDLREAVHAGAACPPDIRKTLTQLREQNAADSANFMNHVLDASKAVVLQLQTEADIAGLPDSLLAAASDAAKRNGFPESSQSAGPWVITHEMPLYLPFMQYSMRRDLRETLYRAHVTRAASGELDNTPLISDILKRRRQMAKLLGKNTFAELTLENRMAPSVSDVAALLERIRSISHAAATKDYTTLQDYARTHGQIEPLAAWDVPYWAETLRKAQFSFDNEVLRPYFPLPRVLECLFRSVTLLFGISIQPADGKATVWHPDVRFFNVLDSDGTVISHLYFDPYSRPESKRGGAWMDSVLSRCRHKDGSIRLPAALMVCNQSRPIGDQPALMTLSEVTTLYHECGHALQHILTTVDEAAAAGINNVEWDAVELPSQFMENWVFHRPWLKAMTCHVDTGEPLPDNLIDQIIAARWFQAGAQSLRQTFFSALDMALHHDYDPDGPESPDTFKSRFAPDYTVLPILPEDRFLCGFSHIFAGGYAAGYYSYKWAEVLAADAFAAFEEAGLDNPQALTDTGKRFRETILALGGSRHPMEIFRAFRGRDPDPDALLRQSGLLPQ
jgi:oligopeptidase A